MSAMRRRRLGSEGPEIARVGFGAWAIGGGGWAYGWGPQDIDDAIAAMRHALARGIDWIDTAAVYGLGHSEALVGRLLRGLPAGDRPLVFTKCGMVWDDAEPMREAVRDLRPATVRRGCEASLRRLGVERIDLFQFHWPDQLGTPVEDSWGEMARLVDEGKVRWIGVSNFDVALLERCEPIRHVDSLQPPFSLILRNTAAALIPWAEAHGTGVIGYSPMQSGLLTEKWTVERVRRLPEDDFRKRSPLFQPPDVERSLALRDALRPIAARHGSSLEAVAVAWTLAWPGVTGAIVGARSPAQVDGWIDAATLELDEADLDAIAAAADRTGAGSGPARPARAPSVRQPARS
ncbi:MAG TPA: aldo/keto reductase [Longimicrobiales bacterium]|nr:aldo/keto reductase [Longimicrobiales bacterium]